MAGGIHAAVVVCNICLLQRGELNPAKRASDGLETDWYTCQHNHKFGISWDQQSIPEQPLWPPSELQKRAQKVAAAMLAKGESQDTILPELYRQGLLPD